MVNFLFYAYVVGCFVWMFLLNNSDRILHIFYIHNFYSFVQCTCECTVNPIAVYQDTKQHVIACKPCTVQKS
jgi:hypothetical protein